VIAQVAVVFGMNSTRKAINSTRLRFVLFHKVTRAITRMWEVELIGDNIQKLTYVHVMRIIFC